MIRNVVMVKLTSGQDAVEVDDVHNAARARLAPMAQQIERVQFEVPGP